MKQHFAIIVVCLTALIVTVPTALADQDCYTKKEVDSMLNGYRKSITEFNIPDSIMFADSVIDLTDQSIRRRFELELLLLAENQAQLLLYMKRSRRYFPLFDQIFDHYGLPSDLRYVAVAESALRIRARSYARAVGLWQFIASTGRNYRVVVNKHVDQRYDPVASTDAAARYLKDLREQFGEWPLALAGYNMGENGLENLIDDQDTADYFELRLPAETRRYFIRCAAIKYAMENPWEFGIDPLRFDGWDGFELVDTAEVTVHKKLPVYLVTRWCNITTAKLLRLNPELIGDKWTPVSSKKPATYKIKLPLGTLPAFQAGLATLTGKKKK